MWGNLLTSMRLYGEWGHKLGAYSLNGERIEDTKVEAVNTLGESGSNLEWVCRHTSGTG